MLTLARSENIIRAVDIRRALAMDSRSGKGSTKYIVTKRITLVVIATIGLIALSTTSVFAQWKSTNKTHWGFRYSFYAPQGKALDNTDEYWSAPLFDYYMRHDKLERPIITITGGWMSSTKDRFRGSCNPFSATYTYWLDDNKEGNFYVGGGLGFYQMNYEEFVFGTGWVSEGSTSLGAHVLGGYIHNPTGVFAELRADYVDKWNHSAAGDMNFSGWMLTLGTRVRL